MSTVERASGITPGHDRDADDVNTLITAFKTALGYTPDTATFPGDIDEENFSRDAGIREDKILWSVAGHNHAYAAGVGTGARLADKCITDVQLAWHAAASLPYVRTNQTGTQIRYGFYTGMTDHTPASPNTWRGGDPGVVGTTINPVRSPHYYDIPFSSGHYYDRAPVTGRTAQDAGAGFPNFGAVPIVLVTAVAAAAGIGGTLPEGTSDGDIHLAVVPHTTTHEQFTVVLDIPYDSVTPGICDGFKGIYWVAFYDPTQEGA